MSTAIPANPLPTDQQHLQHAFAIFSEASERLCGAYQDLQQQVAQMTRELAAANGELRRQLLEKETLSQRLGLLLAALPGGVVAIDACGRVEEVNPAAVALLGGPLTGLPWPAVAEERLLPTTVGSEWNLKQAEAGGARRLRIESSAPDSAGRRILLIQDITETHAMQERLRRNQRLTVMGEMAAGLAHQLRTPLSTALLYTAHLGNAALADHERRGFADKALERLRHLEYLVRGMLLYVKGETEEWENVVISSFLTEVTQVIEPQMSRRGLHFAVNDKSAGACVLADRKALLGAVVSLLENAMQAAPEGGRVTLDCKETGDAIVVTVTDDGRGIETEIQERLFEPFFTTRAEGTGLGLAIVRSVAQSLGGTVQVRSAPGAGSDFILRLPRQTDKAALF